MELPTAGIKNIEIVTIGVYGFTGDSFFNSLRQASVDTFCDIRRRRGVRGSAYRFANSSQLQRELDESNIRYIYCKELAPPSEIRAIQKQHDIESSVRKRFRDVLSDDFIAAYERACLSDFSPESFINLLGPNVKVVALFCVERKATACHRWLVANKLSHSLGIKVRHLEP